MTSGGGVGWGVFFDGWISRGGQKNRGGAWAGPGGAGTDRMGLDIGPTRVCTSGAAEALAAIEAVTRNHVEGR